LVPRIRPSGKSKDHRVGLKLFEPSIFPIYHLFRRMMVRLTPVSALSLSFVFLAGFLPATAQNNWQVTKTLPVGGVGGWDYLTVDAPGHRLFVPRSTHTMVLDEDSGKVLGDIPGQKTAHGVAIAPSAGR